MHFVVYNAFVLYLIVLGIEITSAYDDHESFEHLIFNAANNPKTPPNTALELSMAIDSDQMEPTECCQLVKRIVSLRHGDNDPKREYTPYCKPVNRCDGFCKNILRQCEPTRTRNLNYTVTVVEQYSKNTTLNHTEIVSIEEHENCECRCKVKKEDCVGQQVFDVTLCKCHCENATDREKNCNNDTRKEWIPYTCSCACSKVEDCNTGYVFNNDTCICEPLQVSTNYATTNLYNLILSKP